MWKKLLVVLLAIGGTFSVIFAANTHMFNTELEAAASSPTPAITFNAASKTYAPAGGLKNIAWPTNGWMDFTNNVSSKAQYVMFDILNPVNSISVSAVVKASSVMDGKATIIGNCEYGGAYLYVEKRKSSAEITYGFSVYLTNVQGWQTITKKIPYDANQVVSLMGVYGNGKLEFFVNGESAGRIVGEMDTIKAADKSTIWILGGDPQGNGVTGLLFKGYVSNAAVYGAKVNEDISFVENNKSEAVTSFQTYSGSKTTFAVANKEDTANVKTSDVTYCILNASDECILSGSNGIVNIYPSPSTGTADIVAVAKGTTKIRAFYEQSITTAGNVPIKNYTDLEIEVKDPLSIECKQEVTTAIAGEAKIAAGKVIGSIVAKGGSEPYVYSLTGKSADYFDIDGTNIIINPKTVSGSLPLGTYTFKVSVTDADTMTSASEDITITVTQSSMTGTFTVMTSSQGQTIGEFLYGDSETAIHAGGKLGTLAINNGLAPYTVKLLQVGNDVNFNNFEIVGLDANNQTNATSLDVIVKQDAPLCMHDILKVGSYKFALSITDASGKSSGDIPVSIKINANIPTIVYTPSNDANTYTYGADEITKKGNIGKITSRDGWGEMKYEVVASTKNPTLDAWKSFKIQDTKNADDTWNVIVDDTKHPNGLPVGTYAFALKATGEDGGSASLESQVIVKKAIPTLNFADTDTAYINVLNTINPYPDFKLTTSNTDSAFSPILEFTPKDNQAQAGLLTYTLTDKTTFNVGFRSPADTKKLPMHYTLTLNAAATDNFEAPSTPASREFVLYKEMSTPVWEKTIVQENEVITAVDVKTSVEIGTIMPQDGVGDFNYKILQPSDALYEAAKGSNYDAFSLDKESAGKGESVGIKNKSALKPKKNADGSLAPADYHIQVLVSDAIHEQKILPITITIHPAVQSAFYFVDKAGGTSINDSGLSVKYDETNRKLLTEGGSTNVAAIYALAPAEKQPAGLLGDASDYASIASDGTITPHKTGTIMVMATKPQDDTYEKSIAYMKLTINKGGQTLEFETDVPEFVPYYGSFSFINIKAELIREDGTTGEIKYRSSTPTICTVEDASLPVAKAINVGNCNIIAENTGDANHEAITQNTNITIYKGISGIFRQRVDKEQLRQGSDLAKAGSKTIIAGIDSLAGGDGNRSFEGISAKKKGIEYGDYFQLNPVTGEITPAKDLAQGTYAMQITIRDYHNYTMDITGTLEVGYEVNNDFQLSYKGEAQEKDAVIEIDYATAIDKTILFQLNTIGKKGGGSVHFALSDDSNQSNSAVLIDDTTGIIKVNRVPDEKEIYKVYAYVEENSNQGYARQVSEPVTIKITKTKQNIAFADPSEIVVAYGDDIVNQIATASIEVNGTQKQGIGTITYASLNPDALEIHPSTGRILMKNNRVGSFTIQATIEDSVGNYETASVQKTITVYNGIQGTFHPMNNLYQGSAEVSAGSDSILAQIYPLSGGYGDPVFTIKQAEKAGADCKDSFKIDPVSGELKANRTLTYGAYDLIISATDENGKVVDISGQIMIGLQQNENFQILHQGVKPAGNLIEYDYQRMKSPNTIQLMTKNALSGSGAQKFIISKETRDEHANGPAISITEDGEISVHRAMKENEEYRVQAYIEESSEKGYAKQTTQEVNINITKTAQIIEFEDANQINASFVEGQKPYSFIVPVRTYVKDTPTITGVGEITYSIVQADDANPADIQVDEHSGEVTVNGTGTVTLYATLVDPDGNYKSVGKSKIINIYPGLSADFTQTDMTLCAGEDKPNKKIGEVSATGGLGEITYAISDSDDAKNADNELFTVNERNGDVKLKEKIKPEDYARHATGKNYKVMIVANSGGGDTFVVEAVIIVEPAKQDFFFTDAQGSGKKTILEEIYQENGSFYLYTNRLGSGTVTYTLSDTSYQDVIALDPTRNNKVQILRASDTTNTDETVEIQATVAAKDGYEEKTITIEVHIKQAVQTIAFMDPAEVYVQFDDTNGTMQTIDATAVLDPFGDVQYTSLTSDVCSVKEDGVITPMLPKTCVIQASNQNQNYEPVSTTKTIHFYQKATGDFKQRQPLHQGDAAIQGVHDNVTIDDLPILAEIINLHGGDGISFQFPSLKAIRDEDGIEYTDAFYIEEATGAIKAQKSLRFGTYTMEITIQDGYGGTSIVKGTLTVGLQKNEELKLLYQGNEPNQASITKDYHTVTVDELGDIQIETTGRLGNGEVQYTLRGQNVPENTDDALVLDEHIQGLLHVQRAMRENETYILTAYVEEDLDQGYAQQNAAPITIQITPTAQEIRFDPVGAMGKALHSENFLLHTLTNIANLDSDGVGTITYSSSDPSIFSVDETTGEVTLHAIGSGDVIATLTDPLGNYQSASAKQRIVVYEGLTMEFSAQEDIHATSASDIVDVNVGVAEVFGGNGTPKYQISTQDIEENEDHELFKMDPDTGVLSLKEAVTPEALSLHGKIYRIQLMASVGTDTITKDIEITILPAAQALYFKTMDGVKLDKIEANYEKDGTIQLHTAKLGNGKVTYHLLDDAQEGVVTQDTTQDAILHIQKITTKQPSAVMIEARVEENGGYEAASVQIPVQILPAKQSIQFQSTKTEYHVWDTQTAIASPATLLEANGDVSSRAITYESEQLSICTIDTQGNVTPLQIGTCRIKALNSDVYYEAVETPYKDIIFYEDIELTYEGLATLPQAETPSSLENVPLGALKSTGGVGDVDITHSFDTALIGNEQGNLVDVTENGQVIFKKDILAEDLKHLSRDQDDNYIIHALFHVRDEEGHEKQQALQFKIRGAKLPAVFDTKDTGIITRTYAPDAYFNLTLLHNDGHASPTFRFKEGDQDSHEVLKDLDPSSGKVTIQNATIDTAYTYVEAVLPAKNGYEGKTIEAPVKIEKAPQHLAFKKQVMKLEIGGSMDVEVSGVEAVDENGTLLDWVLDTKDIDPIVDIDFHTIKANGKVGETIVFASVAGNRNYLGATAQATVKVGTDADETFMISVPYVTYGDISIAEHPLQASIILDTSAGSDKVQTWMSSNTEIAEIDESTGELLIKNAGETWIRCEQTSNSGLTSSDEKKLVVKRKPISITIENKEKMVGEDMPIFTIEEITGLVGNDVIDPPIFSCLETPDKSVDENTPKGSYPITGSYDVDAYPNYDISPSRIKKGYLNITQDSSKPVWYSLWGETSGREIVPQNWQKENILVKLHADESDPYDLISLDASTWNKEQAVYTKEGNEGVSISFKNSNRNAIATAQKVTLKLDKTAPIITSMDGEEIEQNLVRNILYAITFQTFFTPQDELTIMVEDPQKANVKEVSGGAEVEYRAYKMDENTKEISKQPYVKDTTEIHDGKARFQLSNPGAYHVCAIAKDHAGNESREVCRDLHIQEEEEIDEKDTNQDGCPDINMEWTSLDEKGKAVEHHINMDRNHDQIPDLNIDANGDGKADLNIDTDGNGIPDLNLVILTKEDWNPHNCVVDPPIDIYGNKVTYCTGTDAKPQINVDHTGDQIPDEQIKTKNAQIWEADINITRNGKLYLNITKLHTWKPNKQMQIGDFVYETQTDIKAEWNIDSDEDHRPDINIDLNDDGIVDLNIDSDGNGIPDMDIDAGGDTAGSPPDGKPDLNWDSDHDGNPDKNLVKLTYWKPDTNVDEPLPYDTMEVKGPKELKDNGVILEQTEGFFAPSIRLQVIDKTEEKITTVNEEVQEMLDGQEIAAIYDILLYQDEKEIEPDGILRVKIPIGEGIQHPRLLNKYKDGSYQVVETILEDGYLIYETNSLGTIILLQDDGSASEPDPTIPEKERNPIDKGTNTPDTSMDKTKENPFMKNVGGAYSGDETNVSFYIFMFFISMGTLYTVKRKFFK